MQLIDCNITASMPVAGLLAAAIVNDWRGALLMLSQARVVDIEMSLLAVCTRRPGINLPSGVDGKIEESLAAFAVTWCIEAGRPDR